MARYFKNNFGFIWDWWALQETSSKSQLFKLWPWIFLRTPLENRHLTYKSTGTISAVDSLSQLCQVLQYSDQHAGTHEKCDLGIGDYLTDTTPCWWLLPVNLTRYLEAKKNTAQIQLGGRDPTVELTILWFYITSRGRYFDSSKVWIRHCHTSQRQSSLHSCFFLLMLDEFKG